MPLPTARRTAKKGLLLLGLKGLSASARLLGIRIGDAETGAGQAVLVINDGASQINQTAILDEKFDAESGEFFVTGFARGYFHRVGHAGAATGLDVDAEAFAFGIGLADDFGD